MSKNKGFSDTSANRYSLALYELANESQSIDLVEENSLAFLNLISKNKNFNDFMKDPTMSHDIFIGVIKKISERVKLENLFENFLFFLVKKRRFFYFEKILKFFNEICSE